LVLIPCRPAAFDVAAIPTTLQILKLSDAQNRAAILLKAVFTQPLDYAVLRIIEVMQSPRLYGV